MSTNIKKMMKNKKKKNFNDMSVFLCIRKKIVFKLVNDIKVNQE